MSKTSNACQCQTCPGSTCDCGCQNTATDAARACQCGAACACGDSCTCGEACSCAPTIDAQASEQEYR